MAEKPKAPEYEEPSLVDLDEVTGGRSVFEDQDGDGCLTSGSAGQWCGGSCGTSGSAVDIPDE